MSRYSNTYTWFTTDWLGSRAFREMDWETIGIYRALLDMAYLGGGIPADPKACARLLGKGLTARSKSLARALAEFSQHPTNPELLTHPKVEAALKYKREQSLAGAKGANKRWSTPSLPH